MTEGVVTQIRHHVVATLYPEMLTGIRNVCHPLTALLREKTETAGASRPAKIVVNSWNSLAVLSSLDLFEFEQQSGSDTVRFRVKGRLYEVDATGEAAHTVLLRIRADLRDLFPTLDFEVIDDREEHRDLALALLALCRVAYVGKEIKIERTNERQPEAYGPGFPQAVGSVLELVDYAIRKLNGYYLSTLETDTIGSILLGGIVKAMGNDKAFQAIAPIRAYFQEIATLAKPELEKVFEDEDLVLDYVAVTVDDAPDADDAHEFGLLGEEEAITELARGGFHPVPAIPIDERPVVSVCADFIDEIFPEEPCSDFFSKLRVEERTGSAARCGGVEVPWINELGMVVGHCRGASVCAYAKKDTPVEHTTALRALVGSFKTIRGVEWGSTPFASDVSIIVPGPPSNLRPTNGEVSRIVKESAVTLVPCDLVGEWPLDDLLTVFQQTKRKFVFVTEGGTSVVWALFLPDGRWRWAKKWNIRVLYRYFLRNYLRDPLLMRLRAVFFRPDRPVWYRWTDTRGFGEKAMALGNVLMRRIWERRTDLEVTFEKSDDSGWIPRLIVWLADWDHRANALAHAEWDIPMSGILDEDVQFVAAHVRLFPPPSARRKPVRGYVNEKGQVVV